jgi:hypothetical protein
MAGASRGRGVRWPEAAFGPRWRSRTAALTLPPACNQPGHPSSPGRTASTSDRFTRGVPGVMAPATSGRWYATAARRPRRQHRRPRRPGPDPARRHGTMGSRHQPPAAPARPPATPSSQRPPAGPAQNCRSSPATASSCPFTARRTRRWRRCRFPPVRAQNAPIWAACDVVGLDPTAAQSGGYSRRMSAPPPPSVTASREVVGSNCGRHGEYRGASMNVAGMPIGRACSSRRSP